MPVVATACGGPSEIIEDGRNGILVSVGDELGLTSAVATLLTDDKKRNEIASSGRRRIQECFDIDHTIGNINSVFKELLAQKN